MIPRTILSDDRNFLLWIAGRLVSNYGMAKHHEVVDRLALIAAATKPGRRTIALAIYVDSGERSENDKSDSAMLYEAARILRNDADLNPGHINRLASLMRSHEGRTTI